VVGGQIPRVVEQYQNEVDRLSRVSDRPTCGFNGDLCVMTDRGIRSIVFSPVVGVFSASEVTTYGAIYKSVYYYCYYYFF